MKQDPMSLKDGLKNAQDTLNKLIDGLQDLAAQSVAFPGKIAQVLPVNLQNTIEKLDAIAFGTEQESFESLYEFLNTVTLGDLERPSIRGENGAQPVAQPAIDTTPHPEQNPQSAITAHESLDLNSFLRVQYPNKMKESFSPFSVDAIADENNGSWSVGKYNDDLEDISNRNALAVEDPDETDYAGIYVPKMVDPEGNLDEPLPVDAGDVILPENPEEELDWRTALSNAHPYDDESKFRNVDDDTTF